MNDIFKGVPVDMDTIITKHECVTIQGSTALHQQWVWDGVCTESLIFDTDDICSLD